MSAPLSDERLAEIRRSVPAVYPAPWTVEPDEGDGVLRGWLVGYDRSHVAPGLRGLCGLVATVPDYGEALAEFIAGARTAVPELLGEVERLWAVVDRSCPHEFPRPTGDPDADGYGPGDCARCGMTYVRYDWRHGERIAEALEADEALAAVHRLEATLKPHTVTLEHAGLRWNVQHPPQCDALPYGEQCLFDLARELRAFELEPPEHFGTFTGVPYISHDHGDGPCLRGDCPVLIRWESVGAGAAA